MDTDHCVICHDLDDGTPHEMYCSCEDCSRLLAEGILKRLESLPRESWTEDELLFSQTWENPLQLGYDAFAELGWRIVLEAVAHE